MNNDVMPAGTWAWLESLGYSRSDVERITARRLGREKPAIRPAKIEGKTLPGGSLSGISLRQPVAEKGECVAARELTYADLQRPEIMFRRCEAAPKPADQDGLRQDIADSFYPTLRGSILSDFTARLGRGEPFNTAWMAANGMSEFNAELMTKAEIIHRREEALKMRYPLVSCDYSS